MVESFKAALARVQSDFDFYIGCQTDPVSTLQSYDLSPEETATLTDPDRLAMVLKEDLRPRNIPSITVKISGRHDWVNRTKKKATGQQPVVQEVAAIRSASSDNERAEAALKLIEQLG